MGGTVSPGEVCEMRAEEGETPRRTVWDAGRERRDPRRTVWDTAEEGETPGGPPEESLSAHHPSVCWQENCPQIWRVRGIGSTHVPHSSFAWIRLCVQGPTPMPEGPMQAARVTVETRRH